MGDIGRPSSLVFLYLFEIAGFFLDTSSTLQLGEYVKIRDDIARYRYLKP